MGNNCFKSLYIDKQDKIWITTDGNGFFSYDPVTNKFEQFGSKGDGKGTNRKIIMPIIPEDDNHLLLGVDQGGINRFDKVSKTFEYFMSVSYTHLRAHETVLDIVCRLLLEK